MMLHGHCFTIRLVTDQDVPALLEVYRQCEDFLALGPVSTASIDMVRKDLVSSRAEGGLFCGIYDLSDNLIGVVDVIPHDFDGIPHHAFLALLMLIPAYRRRGFGQEITALVEEVIWENPQITAILSGVQANNPAAVRFWQRNGYRIVGGPELLPDQTTVFHLRKDRPKNLYV